jgi:hypothetical protein
LTRSTRTPKGCIKSFRIELASYSNS